MTPKFLRLFRDHYDVYKEIARTAPREALMEAIPGPEGDAPGKRLFQQEGPLREAYLDLLAYRSGLHFSSEIIAQLMREEATATLRTFYNGEPTPISLDISRLAPGTPAVDPSREPPVTEAERFAVSNCEGSA